MMTEQEAYDAGIEKLHISYKAIWVDDDRDWIAPDLRTDPAFAWRVLEAFHAKHEGMFLREVFGYETGAVGGLKDYLYAAVVALGKEG